VRRVIRPGQRRRSTAAFAPCAAVAAEVEARPFPRPAPPPTFARRAPAPGLSRLPCGTGQLPLPRPGRQHRRQPGVLPGSRGRPGPASGGPPGGVAPSPNGAAQGSPRPWTPGCGPAGPASRRPGRRASTADGPHGKLVRLAQPGHQVATRTFLERNAPVRPASVSGQPVPRRASVLVPLKTPADYSSPNSRTSTSGETR
jgi:hypothetical protein